MHNIILLYLSHFEKKKKNVFWNFQPTLRNSIDCKSSFEYKLKSSRTFRVQYFVRHNSYIINSRNFGREYSTGSSDLPIQLPAAIIDTSIREVPYCRMAVWRLSTANIRPESGCLHGRLHRCPGKRKFNGPEDINRFGIRPRFSRRESMLSRGVTLTSIGFGVRIIISHEIFKSILMFTVDNRLVH